MERTGKVYSNFDDADEADATFYASLTGEQRLDILLELIAWLLP